MANLWHRELAGLEKGSKAVFRSGDSPVSRRDFRPKFSDEDRLRVPLMGPESH